MHSFGYRANALLTFAVTILALMCAIGSLSDNLNTPSPSAKIEVNVLLTFSWFVAFCLRSVKRFWIFAFWLIWHLGFLFLVIVDIEYQLVSEAATWKRRGNWIFYCLFYEIKQGACDIFNLIRKLCALICVSLHYCLQLRNCFEKFVFFRLIMWVISVIVDSSRVSWVFYLEGHSDKIVKELLSVPLISESKWKFLINLARIVISFAWYFLKTENY